MKTQFATGSKRGKNRKYRTLVHIVINDSSVTLCGQELQDIEFVSNAGIALCNNCKIQKQNLKY